MVTPPLGAGFGSVTVNATALPSAALAAATVTIASSSVIGTDSGEPPVSMPPERPVDAGARPPVP